MFVADAWKEVSAETMVVSLVVLLVSSHPSCIVCRSSYKGAIVGVGYLSDALDSHWERVGATLRSAVEGELASRKGALLPVTSPRCILVSCHTCQLQLWRCHLAKEVCHVSTGSRCRQFHPLIEQACRALSRDCTPSLKVLMSC